jgi:hypothetical protein
MGATRDSELSPSKVTTGRWWGVLRANLAPAILQDSGVIDLFRVASVFAVGAGRHTRAERGAVGGTEAITDAAPRPERF